MKNMDEFRRSVYEKAEKKAAEEKAKKLRITKFGTIAASLAVVIIPIMLVAGSMPKNNETAESSPSYTETRTDGVKTTAFSDEVSAGVIPSGDVEDTTEKEEMYKTTPVYTTTPMFTVATTPMFTEFETTRSETSRVTTTRAPFEPETTVACTSDTETDIVTTGSSATVMVSGKMITLREDMSYMEICGIMGSDGRVALGAPTYRWVCDDAILTVKFKLAGSSDEPYAESLKAVSFTVSR